MEEVIELQSYVDRKVGEGIQIKGFQGRFKKIKHKIICYLPIHGIKTTKEDWEQFYRDNRAERTAGERGTKVSIYAYYHFLKKEPSNKNSSLYYYAIPKGFTQTDHMNLEADFNTMIRKDGTVLQFRVEQKITKKVGLCTLKENK